MPAHPANRTMCLVVVRGVWCAACLNELLLVNSKPFIRSSAVGFLAPLSGNACWTAARPSRAVPLPELRSSVGWQSCRHAAARSRTRSSR
eukprot:scaffold77379_cov36-Phaeocystis_antarctica.AAC.1